MRSGGRFVKRALDVAGSLIVLLVCSPLLLVLAMLITLDSKGSPFFCQTRVGKDGKLFTLYKLRTMVVNAADLRNADGSTFNSDHDPRVTRVGRFLRRTSLDELPQLVNVLKGDMSLVGPRPDLPDQVRFYTERQRKRLLVKPGLTSWAIVHGRNSLPWEQRRELDVEYVERYSFWLDVVILFRTLALVLRRQGVYASSSTLQASPEPRNAHD